MKIIKLAVLAVSFIWATQAAATPFNQFIAFGDSTIDSGWWAGALNGQCDGVASPCTTGSSLKDTHITNAINNGGTGAPVGVGLMSSQLLAAKYGLSATPANQPGGTNYAISGSINAAYGGYGNLNSNPNLPSTADQIGNYLSQIGGAANSQGLYLISSGGNDITYAKSHFSTLGAKENYLATQAAALATAIQNLQSHGAQHILVQSFASNLTLGAYYKSALWSDLSGAGVDYIAADISDLITTVQADPTFYHFTAATVLPGVLGTGTGSACVWTGSGGSGWGQWCADTATPYGLHYAYLRSADAEQTSLYADDQHLSAAGQALVANYDYSLIQVAVPEPSTIVLFGAGLGALGLLSWRKKRKVEVAVV